MREYVALDLETTGLNADRDAIIEIAALRFDGSGILERFETLVKPEVDLPLRTQQITGITPADLEDAPDIDAALERLLDFVGDRPLVGQSVEHDLKFLRRHGAALGQPALDTFELATILVHEAERYGLQNLLSILGIEVDGDAHRALADAEAHFRLFSALADRARSLPPEILARILAVAEGTAWPLAVVFDEALRRPLSAEAAPPPPRLAGSEEPAGQGDVEATEALAFVDPAALDRSAAALEARIAPGGAMSKRIEGFEDRPGQREMLREVADCLERGDRLLIEAGTGTGKSLAYLLPAAAKAAGGEGPVVVSTHTISLQEQLLQREIPLAEALLGSRVQRAVLKGRANYLCLSRLDRFLARDDHDAASASTAAKLLVWSSVTRSGDKAELLLQPHERETWRRVNAELGCTPDACRHAREGRCWLHQARSRAAASDLVVINHALLSSELLGDHRILPDFAHLVIDEAHQLESVVTDALRRRVTRARIEDAIELVHISGGPLSELARQLPELELRDEERREAARRIAALRAEAERLAPAVAELFVGLDDFIRDHAGKGRQSVRLTDAAREQYLWEMVEMLWDGLGRRIEGLGRGLDQLAESLAPSKAARGAQSLRRALRELARDLNAIILPADRREITWVERGSQGALTLLSAPWEVGDLLARKLYEGRAVVLTSATLRAGDDFEFIRERLALPDAPAVAIAPVFDYARSTLLCLPRDAQPPASSDYQPLLDRTIRDLAQALGGRTMVLYTSYGGLKRSYHALRGPLGAAGIAVMAQGIDGSRHQLLETFKALDTPTVLLGTRSFWEGVDVPGPALSALVIARLPFEVPNDPVYEARSEAFDEPFMEYALPLSVLRFRQGFGRLIRSQRDRGVVVVMDGRVHARGYGSRFVESLPTCRRFEGPASQVAEAALRFLNDEPSADGGASTAAPRLEMDEFS